MQKVFIEKYKGLYYQNWRFDVFDCYQSQDNRNFILESYNRPLTDTIELPDSIEINLSYSVASKFPNEYDKTFKLGSFNLYRDK
mgnify:CR=1 FL=1